MPTRDRAPLGAPCWADLWTSDVDASRHFYSALFGWEALEPNPEFGGYFMFSRDGVPVAGGMSDMGDTKADDRWKVYLATADIATATDKVASSGGTVVSPPMPVADLGVQSVVLDPTGAVIGLWQPGTFEGFGVIGESGAPGWFELHTNGYDSALEFYRAVIGWETDVMSDTEGFRYTTVREHGAEGQVAGVLDAASFLSPGASSAWSIYWSVEDVDATVTKVRELSGAVVAEAEDTPYGRVATVADSSGAPFRLLGIRQ